MANQNEHDLIAEQTVLYNVLTDPEAVLEVSEILDSTEFSEPRHQIIYETIMELRNAGKSHDPVSVATELRHSGNLARAGNIAYLSQLLSPTSLASYGSDPLSAAATVKSIHQRNKLSDAAVRIQEVAQLGSGLTADQALEEAESLIFDISKNEAIGAGIQTLDSMYDDLIAKIHEAADRPDGVVGGLMTGFEDFDDITGGFRPGQFILVAARPGVGKTTLAMDFARNVAFNMERTVLFFSLEMGRMELGNKILSAEARVELRRITRGEVQQEDWMNIKEARTKMLQGKFIIDDNPQTTLSRIRSIIQRQMMKPEGLDMVIIDYLQLMSMEPSLMRLPRQEQVSVLSRGLKLTAKEFGISIIVLSQLNRKSEERTDKVPQVSDLRESGSLEQDADMVLLIYRPEVGDSNTRPGEADLIIGKHRGGETGKIPLTSLLQFSKFVPGTGQYPREEEQVGDGSGGAYHATEDEVPW